MTGEETQIIKIDKQGHVSQRESSLFGVSIRGWIAMTIASTICGNQLMATAAACWLSIQKQDLSLLGSQSAITEPLYGIAYAVMGYYFAKMTMPMQQTPKPTTTP